jgi:hypothetical protein
MNLPMLHPRVIESIKPTLKKMVDDSLLPHIEKFQSAHHVINLQREETYWMRSAYVIKIELNTKLIFTDLEDNRVSINGLDNVTITVSWKC